MVLTENNKTMQVSLTFYWKTILCATIYHTKVHHTRILKDLIPGPMNSIQLIYSMVLIAEYMYGYHFCIRPLPCMNELKSLYREKEKIHLTFLG